MKFRWQFRDTQQQTIDLLHSQLGISNIFARILAARDITSVSAATEFLNPKLVNMHNPLAFHDMPQAITRLRQAIKNREKIFLYGDFDVDGVTATSLLYQCLRLFNADVHYYIPDRLSEGYGMNVDAMRRISERQGRLIITVDCGVSGHPAISEANRLGIDVIVTDHHEVGKTLPPALAVINPKDRRGSYPFPGIAGVGVAFKLAWALCQELSPGQNKVTPPLRSFLLEALALVALGTIADVAPLCDENRVMARYGLSALEKTNSVGLNALKDIANLSGVNPLTSEHVGFRLGPRLNAMGRLESALLCVELLTTDDMSRAQALARRLDQQNQKRKTIQDRIYRQAQKQITTNNLGGNKVLVLAEEEWHPGVIGIVASRLLEDYYRPVLLVALHNGKGRGSARSIPGFHMFQALQSCQQYLEGYGGHEMAAGFKIDKHQIGLLNQALNRRAEEILTLEQMQAVVTIDTLVQLPEINWELINHIEKMAPFGEKNPRPILASKAVEVITNPAPERCGARGDHLNFRVRQGQTIFRAIAFEQGQLRDSLMRSGKCDLVFCPQRHVWGDNEYIQLETKDINVL